MTDLRILKDVTLLARVRQALLVIRMRGGGIRHHLAPRRQLLPAPLFVFASVKPPYKIHVPIPLSGSRQLAKLLFYS